jgi:hypothetical protein
MLIPPQPGSKWIRLCNGQIYTLAHRYNIGFLRPWNAPPLPPDTPVSSKNDYVSIRLDGTNTGLDMPESTLLKRYAPL